MTNKTLSPLLVVLSCAASVGAGCGAYSYSSHPIEALDEAILSKLPNQIVGYFCTIYTISILGLCIAEQAEGYSD